MIISMLCSTVQRYQPALMGMMHVSGDDSQVTVAASAQELEEAKKQRGKEANKPPRTALATLQSRIRRRNTGASTAESTTKHSEPKDPCEKSPVNPKSLSFEPEEGKNKKLKKKSKNDLEVEEPEEDGKGDGGKKKTKDKSHVGVSAKAKAKIRARPKAKAKAKAKNRASAKGKAKAKAKNRASTKGKGGEKEEKEAKTKPKAKAKSTPAKPPVRVRGKSSPAPGTMAVKVDTSTPARESAAKKAKEVSTALERSATAEPVHEDLKDTPTPPPPTTDGPSISESKDSGKKKKELTPEAEAARKAAHARFMRFRRSLESQRLSTLPASNGNIRKSYKASNALHKFDVQGGKQSIAPRLLCVRTDRPMTVFGNFV